MSFGVKSDKSSQDTVGSSSNWHQTGPTSVAQANEFFYGLDALTGGRPPTYNTRQVAVPGSGQGPGQAALWDFQGRTFGSREAAEQYALSQMGDQREDPMFRNLALGQINQLQTGGYGPQYETVTDYSPGSPGRLSKWARDGTSLVDYDYQAPDITYQALTPEQVRAAGGGGATRLLGAQQIYGDREEQLRADPSMTLLQRNFAGGQNTRELGQTSDAIYKEAEAAITSLLSHQADKNLEAQLANASVHKAVADAVYAAKVRNSDLTARDLKDLADIYTRMFGQYSTGGGSSNSNTSGKSSGIGFNFGV